MNGGKTNTDSGKRREADGIVPMGQSEVEGNVTKPESWESLE
jgi:hypothetical protein